MIPFIKRRAQPVDLANELANTSVSLILACTSNEGGVGGLLPNEKTHGPPWNSDPRTSTSFRTYPVMISDSTP